MTGVICAYTPGKLPVEFRIRQLRVLGTRGFGTYIGNNLHQSRELPTPTTIQCGMC